MLKKRGLSQVVTLVLIILIVLGAIAIIWVAFRPTVQDAASQITSQCYQINFEMEECTYVDNGDATYSVTVDVRRNAGSGDWTGVRLVFNDGDIVVDGTGDIPGELGNGMFTVTLIDVPINVDIAPQVGPERLLCQPFGTPIPCI